MKSLLLFFACLYSQYSMAHNLCDYIYRQDNYGRGIHVGFKNSGNRPLHFDEACFQSGVQVGVKLRNATQVWDCEGDFDKGYEQGFAASVSSVGSECYNGGYSAGIADLHIGAREGNAVLVGDSCLESYNQGLSDYHNHLIPTIPTSQPESACYRAGFDDAKVIR